jgi:hypothetical protein
MSKLQVISRACIAVGCLVVATSLAAGQTSSPSGETNPSGQQKSQRLLQLSPLVKPPDHEHAFWDRTNLELLAGVVAVRAMDYASTRHFRARGADEILLSNSIVDNKPLFAGIEVAGTAASIAVSYLFHRTGHHKLERWVSIVHIGAGTFGDVRNYTLAGPRPAP